MEAQKSSSSHQDFYMEASPSSSSNRMLGCKILRTYWSTLLHLWYGWNWCTLIFPLSFRSCSLVFSYPTAQKWYTAHGRWWSSRYPFNSYNRCNYKWFITKKSWLPYGISGKLEMISDLPGNHGPAFSHSSNGELNSGCTGTKLHWWTAPRGHPPLSAGVHTSPAGLYWTTEPGTSTIRFHSPLCTFEST